MKLNWSKRPSTSREGKHFFTALQEEGAKLGGQTRYWVMQSWQTGRWTCEDNHGAAWGDFAAAGAAMRAVESLS